MLFYSITSCVISIAASVLLCQIVTKDYTGGSFLWSSLRLCLGLYPTKNSCQHPFWQNLACLNAFMVQDGSSVAKPRPECSDKPYMLLQSFPCSRLNVQQFPSEDHNNWKLWHRPLDRILCVCLGRRQFSQETKYILKVHKSNKENKIHAFVIKHFCSVSYSYSLRAKNKFLQFSKNTC